MISKQGVKNCLSEKQSPGTICRGSEFIFPEKEHFIIC